MPDVSREPGRDMLVDRVEAETLRVAASDGWRIGGRGASDDEARELDRLVAELVPAVSRNTTAQGSRCNRGGV